eukprot:scaffold24027_cov60-Phaeocystis_antarctica.AAC.6
MPLGHVAQGHCLKRQGARGSRPRCAPKLQPHRAWLRCDGACQRRCSRQRTVIFGISLLHVSLAPVDGDVSLERSHSVMAVRS